MAAAAPYRSQNWALTKPAARGKHGIVVSQNREAAEAGVAILEQGGNAAPVTHLKIVGGTGDDKQ